MTFAALRRPFMWILWSALAAAPAFPQASTATVSGTVRDQTGAVIPGAPVVLTKTDTNSMSRSATNEAGLYVFPGVVPGPYRIEVSSPGMQAYEATLTVQVQQSVVINAVLVPGRTSTTVEVQDVTPTVTVDNPTLGAVLERGRIESLPINGRDFTSLMTTVPGMEGLRAYGERLGSAEVSLDGASLNDRYRGATESRPPGLDTIQEFKVETNSSSAKFSRPTTVVLTTKSGTNQIHGTLFETNRNNAIGKARRREDTYTKAPYLNRNEYGGTFGGPVDLPKLYDGHNRTFFFYSFEGKRQVSPSTSGYNVPSDAMRDGDFRELVLTNGQAYTLYDPWSTDSKNFTRTPFAYGGKLNVIDPNRQSPLFKYLMAVTPRANRAVNPMWDYNYWGIVQNRNNEWTTTFRLDHRISDRDSFYARYNQGNYWNYSDQTSVPLSDGGANNVLTTSPNRTLALSWVRSLSVTSTNEVLLSVSREYNRQDQKERDTDFAALLGLPNPYAAKVFPVINTISFGNLKYQPINPNAAALTYYIADDNYTRIKGRHQFDIGVHMRADFLNTLGDQASMAGSFVPVANYTAQWDPAGNLASPRAVPYTGYGLASLYLGVGSNLVRLNHPMFYGRAKEYAAYFQDKFRVTPKLTLFLGLRWEAWPAYHEKHYNVSGFDLASHSIVLPESLDYYHQLGSLYKTVTDGFAKLGVTYESASQAGVPKDLASSNWKDWAPRGGFAYTVTSGNKPLVVRGGVSLTYFPIPLRPWTEYSRSTVPFTSFLYYNPDDTNLSPDGYGSWSLRNAPQYVAGVNMRNVIDPTKEANGLTRGTANFFDPNMPDTRQTAWNLTLEKEIGAGLTFKGSYFGRHTDYLEMFYDWNRTPSTYTWYLTTGQPTPSGANSQANRPYDQVAYTSVQEYGKYGWGNANGVQLEVQRQYNKGYGFQVYYVLNNAFIAGGDGYNIFNIPASAFAPGWVPADAHERNKETNYVRDTSLPQQRLNGNFMFDLPFGRNKWIGKGSSGWMDKVIGGWQVAGMGSIRSNRFALPSSNSSNTGVWPTGVPVEIYGEKYPIQDCRSGSCIPGYLWWNGYINPNQINSYDANGKPNGVMGVPSDYKPSAAPLNAWPLNPNKNDPMYKYYGTNTVFMNLKNGTQVTPTFDPGLHSWWTQSAAAPRTWGLDASLFKTIAIKERLRLRINADFFNVLNHPNDPTGASSEGLIMTRTSSNNARTTQLSLRLSW